MRPIMRGEHRVHYPLEARKGGPKHLLERPIIYPKKGGRERQSPKIRLIRRLINVEKAERTGRTERAKGKFVASVPLIAGIKRKKEADVTGIIREKIGSEISGQSAPSTRSPSGLKGSKIRSGQ